MKDLYHLSPKAYEEGYQIISMLSEQNQRKIPSDVWHFINRNRDKSHTITLEDINKNRMLEETNWLLAIIYKSYLATKEEKDIIQAKESIMKKRRK